MVYKNTPDNWATRRVLAISYSPDGRYKETLFEREEDGNYYAGCGRLYASDIEDRTKFYPIPDDEKLSRWVLKDGTMNYRDGLSRHGKCVPFLKRIGMRLWKPFPICRFVPNVDALRFVVIPRTSTVGLSFAKKDI